MAISSWPFDGQVVSETEFSKWANMLRGSGLDSGFAVSPSSGRTLAVSAGMGLVRGHAVEDPNPSSVTLDVADASARVDRVVLRLDPTANSITLQTKKGTPGSGTPPALTQTSTGVYELSLARVAVGAGVSVINSGDIIDERVLLSDLDVTSADITDATSLGKSLLTASNRAAVLTALGFSAPVVALLNATTAVQMREAMRFFKNGASFTPAADDLKYTDL